MTNHPLWPFKKVTLKLTFDNWSQSLYFSNIRKKSTKSCLEQGCRAWSSPRWAIKTLQSQVQCHCYSCTPEKPCKRKEYAQLEKSTITSAVTKTSDSEVLRALQGTCRGFHLYKLQKNTSSILNSNKTSFIAIKLRVPSKTEKARRKMITEHNKNEV